MVKKTWVKALKEHFGYKPGEGIKGFSAELKQLTEADVNDLIVEFRAVGVETDGPTGHVVKS
jgi:hypothetical protein